MRSQGRCASCEDGGCGACCSWPICGYRMMIVYLGETYERGRAGCSVRGSLSTLPALYAASQVRLEMDKQCLVAAKELRKYLDSQAKSQKKADAAEKSAAALLFGDPSDEKRVQYISVDIAFLRAIQPHRAPLFFTLPHALYDNADICVVTPAPQRKFKDLIQAADPPMPEVKKIVDVKKLAAKHSEPVARRALATSFDVFFVHHDITQYPKLLTGEFLTHQTPVWMPKAASFTQSIEKSKATVVVPRRGYSNVTVRIAHSGMTPEAIQQNVASLMEQLAPFLTSGLDDILSINLVGPTASGHRVALPIYARDFASTLPKVAVSAVEAKPSADEPPKKKARKA